MTDRVIRQSHGEVQLRTYLSAFLLIVTVGFAAYEAAQVASVQASRKATQQLVVEAQGRRDAALKLADAALKRAQLIIESSPWANIVCDSDGKITECNAAAGKLLGWECEELVGHSSDVIVPEEVRIQHDEGMRRAAAELQASNGDWIQTSKRRMLKALKKDGTEFDAIASIRAIKNGNTVEFIMSLSSAKLPPSEPLQLQEPEPLPKTVRVN